MNNQVKLELIKQGFALRRLIGKKPAYKGSFKQGDSIQDVMDWQGNLGILTGKLSGYVCVDIDRHGKHDGVIKLKEFLEGHQLTLPRTRIIKSPNDGLHYWYKLPKEYEEKRFYPNLDIIKGVDFRNTGQFMVAEGSVVSVGHPMFKSDGTPIKDKNGDQIIKMKDVAYKCIVDVPWEEVPYAPTWLLELYVKPESKNTNDGGLQPTFVASKLMEFEKGVSSGNRNNWLTQQVGFLIGQRMPSASVRHWANVINQEFINPPLTTQEVENMLDSLTRSENYKQSKGND